MLILLKAIQRFVSVRLIADLDSFLFLEVYLSLSTWRPFCFSCIAKVGESIFSPNTNFN